MGSIIDVDPFRCRMWALHDRLEESLTEESCQDELQSIDANGQMVPSLGRRLIGDPAYDVELVFGARRLLAAQLLRIPIRVELRELSDRDAFIAMSCEDLRKNKSPYEIGIGYSRSLRTGLFASQEELARALHVSPAKVSRALKLARLPSVIVSAFRAPLDICEGWGIELSDAWEDASKRDRLAARARSISERSDRLSARAIFRYLIGSPARKTCGTDRDQVVRDSQGFQLFKVQEQRRTIALLLPTASVSHQCLQKIIEELTRVLQDERSQVADSPSKRSGRLHENRRILVPSREAIDVPTVN